MIAAIHRPLWHAALAACVFPATVYGLLAPFRELASQQRTGLAWVSFGIFWAMYLSTRFIRAVERKAPPRPLQGGAGADPSPAAAMAGSDPTHLQLESGQEQTPIVSLEELQGLWLCENSGHAPNGCHKRIEIQGDSFALQISQGDGRPTLCARGNVKVEKPGALPSLVFASSRQEPPPRS